MMLGATGEKEPVEEGCGGGRGDSGRRGMLCYRIPLDDGDVYVLK